MGLMETYTLAPYLREGSLWGRTNLYRVQFLLFQVPSLDAPLHILHDDSPAAAIDEDAAEGISELARLVIEGEKRAAGKQHGEQL